MKIENVIGQSLPEENQDETIPTGKLVDQEEKRKILLNAQLEQDLKERKRYAHRIYALIVGWLSILGILLVLQGIIKNGFELSEGVVLALIGGTTANVLGMFYIVLKYLFPDPSAYKQGE